MKTMPRNALYALVAEFLHHQPTATPKSAWLHFSAIASEGLISVLVSFDGHEIEFVPDPAKRRTKAVNREAFIRQFKNIKKSLAGCG